MIVVLVDCSRFWRVPMDRFSNTCIFPMPVTQRINSYHSGTRGVKWHHEVKKKKKKKNYMQTTFYYL